MAIRVLFILLLLLGQAAFVSAVPAATRTSPPEVMSFTVEPVEALDAGTELAFTLEGTPGAKASVRIGGLPRAISLQETESGVYRGSYTLRKEDRIAPNAVVVATLQRGTLSTKQRLAEPLVPLPAKTGETARASESASSREGSAAATIDRFAVAPVDRIEPGTELNFTLMGTPGGKATFSIEGVARGLRMDEVVSGTYEGRYTVRRQDRFPPSVNATAVLQVGNSSARSRLDQALVPGTGAAASTGTAKSIPLEFTSPANNSPVGKGPIEVKGRSAPNTSLDVQVQATASLAGMVGFNRNILTQTVQTDSRGNFSVTFEPPIAVPGARYEMTVSTQSGGQPVEKKLTLIQK